MPDLTANIFNIQHFSTEDGPGVRTTVFFKGCPLRCLWCSNPESQKSLPQLANRKAICIHCGMCIKTCKLDALNVIDGHVKINREKCNGCGDCVKICPSHAMFFYGEEKTIDEVFNEVIKDAGFYKDCNGGITCSGGECMLQAEFISELFKRCKNEGIHTCLDSCGQFPTKKLENVLLYTDLVLFDLKHMDIEKHRKYTGFGNELILENLKAIIEYGTEVYIRIPVIPEYNDSIENLKATAEYVKSLKEGMHVDLLPYHKFGEAKYNMLNIDYLLKETKTPSDTQMKEYVKIFTGCGLDCTAH